MTHLKSISTLAYLILFIVLLTVKANHVKKENVKHETTRYPPKTTYPPLTSSVTPSTTPWLPTGTFPPNTTSSPNPHIAFTVMRTTSYDSGLSPNILTFDKEVTNLGGWLDMSSSQFKVPLNGMYFFNFNFVSGWLKEANVKLCANGKHVPFIHANAVQNFSLGSQQAFLNLKLGDSVWLEVQANSYINNSDLFCTFSGHLVAPEDQLDTSVAFTVARNTSFTGSTDVLLTDVITNVGNAFDISTSKFIVPFDGVYFFLFNAKSVSRDSVVYLFNNAFSNIALYSSRGAHTGQNAALLYLNARDEVSLKLRSSNDSISSAAFSGVLLGFQEDSDIAFSVARDSTFEAASNAVTVLFTQVFINSGLGFDIASSHFNAPIRGIYHFTVHAVSQISKSMKIHLIHNGEKVACLQALPAYKSSANHIILAVEEIDSIWLELQPHMAIHNTEVQLHLGFSGYLLYRQ